MNKMADVNDVNAGAQGNTNPPAATGTSAVPPVEPTNSKTILEGDAGNNNTATDPNSTAAATKVVPENYEIKIPEGFASDVALTDEFKGIAKAAGLSQEEVDKLIGLQVKTFEASKQASLDAFNQTQKAWKAETISALGANAPQELAYVGKAMDQFAPKGTAHGDAFRELMHQSGLGDNLNFVKVFIEVGKKIAQDVPPAGNTSTKLDHADAIYGKKN